MADDLHILCAGAVKGLVLAVQAGFEADAGVRLHARFGAVGAMRDELAAGAPCDVFIATEAMVGSLAASGALRAGSSAAIGRVQTAIAVRAGAPLPAIDSADSLKSALLAAAALYIPDATLSTAGAHVVAVLTGSASARRSRRACACTRTARRRCASSPPRANRPALGCTQATEIRYTPGLALVGAAAGTVRARDRLQRGDRHGDARRRSARAASSTCSRERPAPGCAAPAGSIRLSGLNAAQLSGP